MCNDLANGLGKGIVHGDSIVGLEGLVLEQDLGRDGRTAQLVVVSVLLLEFTVTECYIMSVQYGARHLVSFILLLYTE
jgi:hypothetical protein